MRISSTNKSRALAAVAIGLVSVLYPVLRGLGAERCNEAPYGGFDSRLSVVAIGLVPIEGNPVIGFEVIRDKPVVAFPHRLLALTPKGVVSWTSLDEVTHI